MTIESNEIEIFMKFFRNSCTLEELQKVKKWISEGSYLTELETAMKKYESDFGQTSSFVMPEKIHNSLLLKIQKKISRNSK